MVASPIQLSGIFVYPIKSLRGISLADAALNDGRLEHDREWLVIGRDGWFMHQRDYPQMTRIEPTIIHGGVIVRADGLPPLEIPRRSALAAGN